jgi:hypothetical protein
MVSIFAFYDLTTWCHGINKNVDFIILINNIMVTVLVMILTLNSCMNGIRYLRNQNC